MIPAILKKGNIIEVQVNNEDEIPELLFSDLDTRLRILKTNENNSCTFRGRDGLLLLTGDFYYGFVVYPIINDTGIKYQSDLFDDNCGNYNVVKHIPIIEPQDLQVNLDAFKKIYEAFNSFSGEDGDPLIPISKKGDVYTLYDWDYCI
jgi:hypothetical protein